MTDTAIALRDRLRARELSCAEVAEAFLATVGEDELRAWAALDRDVLLARAAELDRLRAANRAALPLFGVPVGVKDNFDTTDYPTAYGSPIYAGHRPASDAGAVRMLRAAGAMVVGKTKLSEFAWMFATDTVNPLGRTRTPGGSSSGSAAAVAAGAVPLATGSQTAGSINRPASYCGVIGYKPTFGLFPTDGVKPLARSLDTVGLFGRSVADVRLAATVLGLDTDETMPPGPRRVAFMRTPNWPEVEPSAQAAIEGVVQSSATPIEEIEAPPGYDRLVKAQMAIMWVEATVSLASELAASPELMSDEIKEALANGEKITAERYAEARREARDLGRALTEVLDVYDGVLTPSTSGVPPVGLYFTGDPRFCRVETLIGAPSISLPLAWAPDGLPVGLQLLGAPGRDARTLACAELLLAER